VRRLVQVIRAILGTVVLSGCNSFATFRNPDTPVSLAEIDGDAPYCAIRPYGGVQRCAMEMSYCATTTAVSPAGRVLAVSLYACDMPLSLVIDTIALPYTFRYYVLKRQEVESSSLNRATPEPPMPICSFSISPYSEAYRQAIKTPEQN
jgi:uncharacterized protein YceK